MVLGEASLLLGVCVQTLRRWDESGRLVAKRTFGKKGLNKLINLIINKQINRLVITHKDRLLRFGSELLFNLCHFYNIDVVILNDNKNITNAQQLAEDVLAILTVFSAKMHGFRSHKNKNII